MEISKKIKEALSKLLLAFSEVSTDKGILSYDSEELQEGAEVFIVAEDGSQVKAEDGDYTLEDGTVVSVADGKIASIVKPEPEVSEESPKEDEPKEVSEEELKKKKEACEEPESEEGLPEEKPEAEEPVEEPKDEPKSDEVLDAIKALEDKIAALEERIAKIEECPAAEPVAEEFHKAVKSANTNDSHMEFLKKMAAGK